MQSVQVSLRQFLSAFAQLRLDEMLSYFAEDATAFFPVEHQRERLNGKAEIREAFGRVLEKVRATGATTIRLDAEDMVEQSFDGTYIFTFHLRGQHLSRRTFVLRERAGEWRIIHFHGSNAA